ncbi:MAG: hypothetical protein ACP5KP_04480 [Candidatus Micrarchaeia archaeon]
MKVLLIMVALFLTLVNPTQYITNSKEWRDVYLTLHYADLAGESSFFIRNEEHGTKVLPYFVSKSEPVVIVESETNAFIPNYETYLKTLGFTNVSTLKTQHPYLLQEQFLEMLKNNSVPLTGFVLVDDAYGYDAVSVAQYAFKYKKWVLFTTKENRNRISSLLEANPGYPILFYGHMRREIADAISKFNIEKIDNQSRFRNNMELAEMMIKNINSRQILLTSGEYIEHEIMSGGDGNEVILFVSADKYPEDIINFIRKHNIKYVTVVGNELINTAREVKEAMGGEITVIAKYGVGYVGVAELQGQIYALDLFYLPKYQFNLTPVSAVYNPSTKELYIRFKNNGNVGNYFYTSAPIVVDENSVTTVIDKENQFLEPGDEKVIVYNVDLTGYIDKKMYAHLYTKYGESPYDMMYYILEPGAVRPPYKMPILVQEYEDNSQLEIVDGWYDDISKEYIIQVSNVGPVDAYAKGELKDIVVDGIPRTITQNGTVFIRRGETASLPIHLELLDEDKKVNPTIHAIVYYGQSQDILIKKAEKDIELKSQLCLLPILLIVALLIAMIIGYYIWKKRKTHHKAKTHHEHAGERSGRNE